MSNHHARPRPSNKGRLLATIVVTAVVLVFLGLIIIRNKPFKRPWPSVVGNVLETRVTAVASLEGGYRGGLILYQVEAHVVYEVNGQQFDRWLPASDTNRDKAYLQFWLSQKKSKLCIVHWNPANPSDIEVLLT